MHSKLLQFAVSETRVVPNAAAADEIWRIITDLDSFPDTFSVVKKVRRLDGSKPGDALRVGSRFALTMQLETGERSEAEGFITVLETTDDLPTDDGGRRRVVRKLTSFYDDMAGGGTLSRTTLVESSSAACVGPSVLALTATDEKPSDADGVCRVTISVAVVPRCRPFLVVGRLLCCCLYEKRVRTTTQLELDELIEAAFVVDD